MTTERDIVRETDPNVFSPAPQMVSISATDLASLRTRRAASAERVCEKAGNVRKEWTEKHVVNSPLDLAVVELICQLTAHREEWPKESTDQKKESRDAE